MEIVFCFRGGTVVRQLVLLPHKGPRVPCLILSSGYCKRKVLCVLPVSVWVGNRFFNFLPSPKNILVNELARLGENNALL